MIDKLQYNPLNLQATSVYNFNEFTLQELLNRFFQTINECVESSNKALDFLTWLKGEGLSKEVKKYLDEMYTDGRLEALIDEYAGNLQGQIDSLDRQIDELNTETHDAINGLESKVNVNKVESDNKFANLNLELIETEKDIRTVNSNNYSDLQNLFKDDDNIVFTGDSVSFNRYSFTNDSQTNAYEHYPGLLSWSFMTRDLIHRSDEYFKTVEELKISTNTTISFNGGTKPYAFPFNGIYTSMSGTTSLNIARFYYRTSMNSKKIILHLFENNTTPCTFDVYVKGIFRKTISNDKNTNTYNGFSPFMEEVTGDNYQLGETVLIEFRNIQRKNTSQTGYNLYFQGVGSKNRNIYMSGHGGWKSSDLLENISDRILKYNPNFVSITIGANDIFYNVGVTNYINNIEQIILNTLSQNPSCRFLLMGSPKLKDYETQTIIYNNALKLLSLKYNAFYVDFNELFQNYLVSEWRYDNVHLNRLGNTILVNKIYKTLFNPFLTDNRVLNSENYYYLGQKNNNKNSPQTTSITFSNSSFVVTPIIGSLNSNVGEITVSNNIITIPFNGIKSIPKITQFGSVTQFCRVHIRDISTSGLNIVLIKNDGSILQSSDFEGNCSLLLSFD